MKATKQSTAGAVSELDSRIDKAVSLQGQIEKLSTELKAEREAIKTVMQDAELERQATAAGNEALLVEEERYSWDVGKLEKVLDDEQFDALCPRTAKGAEVRKVLEGAKAEGQAKIAKELRACAKVSKSERLEVRTVSTATEKAG